MKIILSFFAVVLWFTTKAQQTRLKTNEIGLFTETIWSNSSFKNKSFGLQYKRTNKPNHALRFQMLFNQSSIINEPYEYKVIGDTIRTKNLIKESHAFFVGFGLEQQRHFYKHCFLYASLDARLGYGFADYYNVTSSRIADTLNNVYFFNSFNQSNSKEKINSIQSYRFALDLMPSIGSKLILRNLVFGMETGFNLRNAYETQKGIGIRNYSIYNLDLSLFYYRAYINFRF